MLHGPELRNRVRLAEAKERFADELEAPSIPSTVVRPTAYFSDMEAFLDVARKGGAFVVGDGNWKMNPISGEDLAVACIEAAEVGVAWLEVGGSDVLTHNKVVHLAFAAGGRKPRIIRIPEWAAAGIALAMAPTTRNASTALSSSSSQS